MKVILVLSALLALAISTQENKEHAHNLRDLLHKVTEKYHGEHGVQRLRRRSTHEYKEIMKNFAKAVETIDNVNADASITHSAEYNKISIMSDAERQNLLGYRNVSATMTRERRRVERRSAELRRAERAEERLELWERESGQTCSDGRQTDYRGMKNVTKDGIDCQRWDKQSPHIHLRNTPANFPNAGLEENYCRNPDGDSGGVWCYTTDPNTGWQYCEIPSCAEQRRREKERREKERREKEEEKKKELERQQKESDLTCSDGYQRRYRGMKNVTKNGLECQRWDSQSPHKHRFIRAYYPDAGLEENYCRNPSAAIGGAWCYTTDPNTRWQYCEIPTCAEQRRREKERREKERREKERREKERREKERREKERREKERREKERREKERQQKKKELERQQKKKELERQQKESDLTCSNWSQEDYRGRQNITTGGFECQRWDSQSPNKHDTTPAKYPDAGLEENYCRNPSGNPNGASKAWCYIADDYGQRISYDHGNGIWEKWDYCDVPTCCYENWDAYQTRYRGMINVTKNGLECQRWDSQSPHKHRFIRANFPGHGLRENYCRNPSGDSGGAWCYTTDPNTRFQYCEIPSCYKLKEEQRKKFLEKKLKEADKTCAIEPDQADYRGTINWTYAGYECQRWDSQSPNSHGATPDKFPDAGLEDNNYCRNPGGQSSKAWCFVTEPSMDMRWQYCDVPSCMGPESLDWVARGALNPPKDQGGCGSCWAFAAAAAVEANYYIKTGEKKSFAEQEYLDCAKCNGCNGGDPARQAMRYTQKSGHMSLSSDVPYTASSIDCPTPGYGKCKWSGKPNGLTKARLHKYYRKFVKTDAAYQTHLQSGVLVVGIVTAGDWDYYRSGVWDCNRRDVEGSRYKYKDLSYHSCSGAVNHAVVITGYGKQSGIRYWNVRNSWGEDWGDGGYIKMTRDGNGNVANIHAHGGTLAQFVCKEGQTCTTPEWDESSHEDDDIDDSKGKDVRCATITHSGGRCLSIDDSAKKWLDLSNVCEREWCLTDQGYLYERATDLCANVVGDVGVRLQGKCTTKWTMATITSKWGKASGVIKSKDDSRCMHPNGGLDSPVESTAIIPDKACSAQFTFLPPKCWEVLRGKKVTGITLRQNIGLAQAKETCMESTSCGGINWVEAIQKYVLVGGEKIEDGAAGDNAYMLVSCDKACNAGEKRCDDGDCRANC